MCLFHLKKKQEARVFASVPIEAMTDQTFRLRPCMPDLSGDIHKCSQTDVFRRQKQQERDCIIHIKSYMSAFP